MTLDSTRQDLLAELEMRQEAVLAELEALDRDIQRVIGEHTLRVETGERFSPDGRGVPTC